MISLLITLGWIALLIGVVLLVVGLVAAPQAVRPGWAGIVLGAVLLIVGYVLGATGAVDVHDAMTPLLLR